jgi:hypothetical protein
MVLFQRGESLNFLLFVEIAQTRFVSFRHGRRYFCFAVVERPPQVGIRTSSSSFKIPVFVADEVTRLILSLGIEENSEPPHVGCYFSNGLPAVQI